MTSPIIALRAAIRAHLITDAALVAALNGEKIFDEAPQGAETPYVLLAETQARDWSADLSPGAEQLFTLSVISTMRGAGEALDLADRIKLRLDEAALALQDHRLVDLRFLSLETRREQQGRFARVNLRFRAVTENL